MNLDNIPEPELAQKIEESLVMFIKISDAWLARVPDRPPSSDGRKFKNRMQNANTMAKHQLASLNGEVHKSWK